MHRARHGCGAVAGEVPGVGVMDATPVFTGLALIALGLYMGLAEIATALGKPQHQDHMVRVTIVKDK